MCRCDATRLRVFHVSSARLAGPMSSDGFTLVESPTRSENSSSSGSPTPDVSASMHAADASMMHIPLHPLEPAAPAPAPAASAALIAPVDACEAAESAAAGLEGLRVSAAAHETSAQEAAAKAAAAVRAAAEAAVIAAAREADAVAASEAALAAAEQSAESFALYSNGVATLATAALQRVHLIRRAHELRGAGRATEALEEVERTHFGVARRSVGAPSATALRGACARCSHVVIAIFIVVSAAAASSSVVTAAATSAPAAAANARQQQARPGRRHAQAARLQGNPG